MSEKLDTGNYKRVRRSKGENFKRTLFPILACVLVTFLCSLISGEFAAFGQSTELSIVIVGTHILTQLIFQVLALFTCWLFVLRPNRADIHVWINYLVWMLIMNLGKLYNAGLI